MTATPAASRFRTAMTSAATRTPRLRGTEDAKDWARGRFERARLQWLSGAGAWPLRLPLGRLTEAEARGQPALVQRWQRSWHDWQGAGAVHWKDVHWPSLGVQRLPQALVLPSPEAVAELADARSRWYRASERLQQARTREVFVGDPVQRDLNELEFWDDADFERLLTLLAWLRANPESGHQPRELPVPGLDSKWLEQHAGSVRRWLARVLHVAEPHSLYELAGLRRTSQRVRLRLLDSSLREQVGGLGDLEAPVEDLAALPVTPRVLLCVENVQTGLAYGDLPGTALIMGLGYAIDALAALPWARDLPLFYWGDLDTHGFAILDRLRARLPQAKSLLMDRQTLLAHRALWTDEPRPAKPGELPRLTANEHAVYTGLIEHRWGERVRLEQERISWELSLAATIDALRLAVPQARA